LSPCLARHGGLDPVDIDWLMAEGSSRQAILCILPAQIMVYVYAYLSTSCVDKKPARF
jgi:hypothetical protein